MKSAKTLLALTVAAGILAAAVAPANAIGIFAQWQKAEDADDAYGVGLKHKFGIIPMVVLEARASWLSYNDANAFPLEAFGGVKIALFYVGAGAGYYVFSGDLAPDNSFGGFVAGGIDFTLFGLGAFGELRYLFLEPDGTFGGDLSGVGANVGVTLPF